VIWINGIRESKKRMKQRVDKRKGVQFGENIGNEAQKMRGAQKR
jgi:hypothetical protein